VNDCEVLLATEPRTAVVRGAFEVEGHPHEWLGVFFQVRLSEAQALQGADGKDFLRKWGDLFTPDIQDPPVRWNECRLGIPFEDLEKTANLPRGARTVLWVACDVWDSAGQAWAATGWDARCPVVVTTDAAGRITALEPFYTTPHRVSDTIPWEKKPALATSLDLRTLKLKAGTTTCRCVCMKHVIHDVFHRSEESRGADGAIVSRAERQTEIESLDRGYFFEPLGTAAQAQELAALAHRGQGIVSKEAYATLKAHEKRRELLAPPSFGIETDEVPGLGWRVRMLVTVEGQVRHYAYAVSHDGRLARTKAVCLDGWYIDPGSVTPLVPDPVRLTEEETTVPRRPDDVGLDAFLPPADWPASARKSPG
jgi:hypothetical protein